MHCQAIRLEVEEPGVIYLLRCKCRGTSIGSTMECRSIEKIEEVVYILTHSDEYLVDICKIEQGNEERVGIQGSRYSKVKRYLQWCRLGRVNICFATSKTIEMEYYS